jgi:hypothetical protein
MRNRNKISTRTDNCNDPSYISTRTTNINSNTDTSANTHPNSAKTYHY